MSYSDRVIQENRNLYIVGIHDNHNASVCLLKDGNVLFAIEEERLSRVKNHCGFPFLSLDLTLRANDLTVDSIDVFAFSFEHCPPTYDKSGLMRWYASSDSLKTRLIEAFKQSPGFELYKDYSKHQRMKRIKKAGIPLEAQVRQSSPDSRGIRVLRESVC